MMRLPAALLLLAAAVQAVPPAHSSWTQIFADEFDAVAMDATKWSNGYALEATGPRSWPDPTNVKFGGGTVKFLAANRSGQGKEFAGSAIITRGKFSHQYGYVEARVKVPVGNGLSAKLTGVPAQGKFPPWLDIVETLGRTPNTPYWVLHAGGREAGGGFNVPDMASDWHVFGTEWKADEFIFYFDGVEKMRDRTLAPLVRMNLCWALEMMVGDHNANWIGAPNAASWTGVYEVDYVRIYRNAGPPSALARPVLSAARDGVSAPWKGFLATGRLVPSHGTSAVLCAGDGCSGTRLLHR